MNKPLKYSLIGIAGLLFLVILAAVVFALTFDANRYKPQIERLVQEKTGRTLKLQGPLEAAFWPSLGAKVSGVSLTERGSEQQFVVLDNAHASVGLMALLRGQVVVDKIRVSGLKANVVKRKDGTFNFSDLMEAKGEEKPSTPDKKGSPKAEEKEGPAVAFDIAGIEIDKSAVTYRDLAAGQTFEISDFKLTTGRLAERSDGKLALQLHAKGNQPQLDLRVDLSGQYKLDLPKAAALENLNLRLNGAAAELKNLAVSITGGAFADLEKETASSTLAVKFDETSIQAKAGLTKFSPPAYTFDITGDKLNLDRYFPPEQKPVTSAETSDKPAAGKAAAPAQAGAKPAADTPVDLSALKDLNATGKLRFGFLQVRGVKLSELAADLKAAGGRVELPHSAKLYEGGVTGVLQAQADGRIAMKEALTGIAIGPLLRDAAQKDILEGKGNVGIDVSAAGKSVNAMKKALNGTAKVDLRDGAIKGIDIAAMLQKARNMLGRQEAQAQAAAQRTDFSAMTATFTIKNGVAHNEDLDVKAPLFRVSGRGDIDIGNGTIDYVTKASLVNTTKGQGGADVEQLSGLTVPVRLSGPFDAMKYDVNYGAVAADVAKSRIGERLKGRLEERLGLKKDGEKGGSGEAQSGQGSTIDRLKGLLGR